MLNFAYRSNQDEMFSLMNRLTNGTIVKDLETLIAHM